MGRGIRLTTDEAIATGLLDPEVAEMMRAGETGAKTGKRKNSTAHARSGTLPDGSGRRKRKPGKEGPAPVTGWIGASDGSLTLLADGRIDAADFFFDVVPVPKERAKIVKSRGDADRSFGYTPARTRHFTAQIKAVIDQVRGARAPITGAVRIEMTFVIPVPKSWPKWKKAAARDGHVVPTGRPDMDNLEKALLDAFNATIIEDDAFVTHREADKRYGTAPAITARIARTGQLGVTATRDQVAALRKATEEATDDD